MQSTERFYFFLFIEDPCEARLKASDTPIKGAEGNRAKTRPDEEAKRRKRFLLPLLLLLGRPAARGCFQTLKPIRWKLWLCMHDGVPSIHLALHLSSPLKDSRERLFFFFFFFFLSVSFFFHFSPRSSKSSPRLRIGGYFLLLLLFFYFHLFVFICGSVLMAPLGSTASSSDPCRRISNFSVVRFSNGNSCIADDGRSDARGGRREREKRKKEEKPRRIENPVRGFVVKTR